MALLQEISVPLLAVNDTSLTVVEIAFSNGAKVKKGDLIMVFETSKTTYDVEAPEEGYIQYLCETDEDYAVNEIVARIYSEAAEAHTAPAAIHASAPVRVPPAVQAGASAAPDAGSLPNWEGETLFSLEASRLIVSAGIDKAVFAGKDFVTGADVSAWLQPTGVAANRQAKTGAGIRPVLPVDPRKAILEKLSLGKKREIEYLEEVQSTGLTSTVHSFVDTEGIFTPINRSLKYLKDSLLPVIIYEASRLLTDYPLLNAYFTGEAVAVYKEVNTGFAIDINKGLKVLKIARSEQKSIREIEQAILDLSGGYLDDTLLVEDMTDITFTITDLSGEGVAFFRPLINKMNSAILGISGIDTKLHRCALSLTFDHRVTEGKFAARFLKDLKERLESYRPRHFTEFEDISCFKCYKTLKEDLGGIGFARCITPEGKEGYICQSCLNGF